MKFTNNSKLEENVIVRKSFELALEVYRYSRILNELKHYDISRQLLRSGASIGANVREAQNAESRKDFFHKMKIALKESDELDFWLLLVNTDFPSEINVQIQDKLPEVTKILNKIVSSTKKQMKSN